MTSAALRRRLNTRLHWNLGAAAGLPFKSVIVSGASQYKAAPAKLARSSSLKLQPLRLSTSSNTQSRIVRERMIKKRAVCSIAVQLGAPSQNLNPGKRQ